MTTAFERAAAAVRPLDAAATAEALARQDRPTKPPAGPAMDLGPCRAALDLGAELAADLVDGATGARALVTGEMGIGNTTAAAALVAAFTGRPAVEVTGRGTGVDDAGLARKIGVVDR